MSTFITIFVILTIAHPISDFIVRNITWDKWYGEPLHYLIALNPFHFLWDKSLGTIHSRYVLDWAITKNKRLAIIEHGYWLWLGIDQLAHQLLNLLLAILMENLI